jgi:hypothetical protein
MPAPFYMHMHINMVEKIKAIKLWPGATERNWPAHALLRALK